jgi:3-oxoacyl-[acyl-carrier protein] reductase
MRNVIVTGGSRGLGLGIARKLSSAGYRVIAVARSESDELREAREIAEKTDGGSLQFRACDLSDLGAIPELVKGVRRDVGALYGLVNNAGIGPSALLSNMPGREIEALVRLNTVSPMIITKSAVRAMMIDGEGRIINMSSIVASTGFSGLSVYSATKASLIGFTRALAREVGPLGITVNAIAPGFIDTEMTGEFEGPLREKVVRRSPLGRLAGVDDIAEAAAYLLGDGGRNITGTVLTIDAGSTA